MDIFEEYDVSVFAMSTDTLEKSSILANKLGLRYPVIHGIDGSKIAKQLEAYYDEKKDIIQPTSFLIRDKKIIELNYSSGPLGRLIPTDVISFIEYLY